MTETPEPPPDAAESRAIELLRLVAGRTPPVDRRFTTEVVTRARVQHAISVPARAIGGLLAALATAFGAAIRGAAGTRREP
jgi:hypothetical protein